LRTHTKAALQAHKQSHPKHKPYEKPFICPFLIQHKVQICNTYLVAFFGCGAILQAHILAALHTLAPTLQRKQEGNANMWTGMAGKTRLARAHNTTHKHPHCRESKRAMRVLGAGIEA
jgi:hypothetical protein